MYKSNDALLHSRKKRSATAEGRSPASIGSPVPVVPLSNTDFLGTQIKTLIKHIDDEDIKEIGRADFKGRVDHVVKCARALFTKDPATYDKDLKFEMSRVVYLMGLWHPEWEMPDYRREDIIFLETSG
jgi:hypothetical protein